jgi:DNA topoisomerase I
LSVKKSKPSGNIFSGFNRIKVILMVKPLIIVESPTKARSITKYLAQEYTVIASKGHIRDLPKTKMGVDTENGFDPKYVTLRDKKDVISAIKKAAKNAPIVLLAPDPDREGEAIAWHINEIIKPVNDNVKRVLFNEITKKGIKQGLDAPRDLDQNLFESQQARRILDRLVGYELSPLLWKKVRRGLSAGRVQSVTLRLIVEREKEINRFDPREFWTIAVELKQESGEIFKANLWKVGGKKAVVPDGETAKRIESETVGTYTVKTVTKKVSVRKAPPPFITSTLQQEASKRFFFSAKRTMMLAQKLYEGIELGEDKEIGGLITYMRTDSTRVSDDAIAGVRDYIVEKFGAEYLPEKPNAFKTKKGAQDAHEAIRPTDTAMTPEMMSRQIHDSQMNSNDAKNLSKLYELIWRRFVASQIKPALFDMTVADIERGSLIFRCQGQVVKFKGFKAIYSDKSESTTTSSSPNMLPPIEEGDTPDLVNVLTEQKFTQPPPRFSEATLIKEMEDKGIGRPSTYAAIISTLANRKYMVREKRKFIPTELGNVVTDLLYDSFPNILSVKFTAQMEEKLDDVEGNKVHWRELLSEFYQEFHKLLLTAEDEMPNMRAQVTETDIDCNRCGAKMVIRWGANGKFLACSTYPECKNSKEFIKDAEGKISIVEPEKRDEKCPICSEPMIKKHGKFGNFLGCSNYPDCKGTMPYILPFDCPEENCDGKLIERKSKRGKIFFGCSKYNPKDGCNFSTWDEPVDEKCSNCGWEYLFRKKSRRKNNSWIECPRCKEKKVE